MANRANCMIPGSTKRHIEPRLSSNGWASASAHFAQKRLWTQLVSHKSRPMRSELAQADAKFPVDESEAGRYMTLYRYRSSPPPNRGTAWTSCMLLEKGFRYTVNPVVDSADRRKREPSCHSRGHWLPVWQSDLRSSSRAAFHDKLAGWSTLRTNRA